MVKIIYARMVLVMSAVGLALSSCSGESGDWANAQKQNTVGAYQSYLRDNPEGKNANMARARIEAAHDRDIRAENVRDNWNALSRGISIDRVDELIGPMQNEAFRRVSRNVGGLMAATGGQLTTTIHQDFYSLRFDSGGLAQWDLTPEGRRLLADER